MFVLAGNDYDGRGQLVEDSFTVFPGSKVRKDVAASGPKWLHGTGQHLLRSGVLLDEGGQVLTKENHSIKSPSGTANAILRSNANGWREWKGKFAGTLHQVKRQVDERVPNNPGEP